MFGNDRDQIRRFFITSWHKRQQGETLTPLERIVTDTIASHPEYHALFNDEGGAVSADFQGSEQGANPFLHMGMHISLQEQLSADRPPGIRKIYQDIAARSGNPHAAEHRMMDCLGHVLWEAQRKGAAPDEKTYLECLRRIAAQ